MEWAWGRTIELWIAVPHAAARHLILTQPHDRRLAVLLCS